VVFVSETTDRQMEFQVQILKIKASHVAQFDMLEMLPRSLDWVEAQNDQVPCRIVTRARRTFFMQRSVM
jgi:hypothetical protein